MLNLTQVAIAPSPSSSCSTCPTFSSVDAYILCILHKHSYTVLCPQYFNLLDLTALSKIRTHGDIFVADGGCVMSKNVTYLFGESSFTDLTLYQFGREQCAPMLSCGPATHNHYLLHYVLKGKGTYSSSAGLSMLTAGQAFLIFPGEITVYTADETDPWEYVWLEFDGLKVEQFLTAAGFSHKATLYLPTSQEGSQRVKDLILSIVENHDNTLRVLGTAYLLLDALIQSSGSSRPPKARTLQEFYVHEALMYIDRNYKEDMSVSQLAAWCGIDRSYFGKIFHDTILMTPQRYIIRYRINVACGLLRDTNKSIREIASDVGYPNQMNFARAFRKVMNMSPSDWRTLSQTKA